jgi:hypothetical protein
MEISEETPPTVEPEPRARERRISPVVLVTAAVILVVTLVQVWLLFL